MDRPRRPAPAGRRPLEAARRSAARRSERVRGGARRLATQAGQTAPGAGLTTRAAVLGLVLCALLVSAALPLREYLAQRGRIGAAVSAQAAQQQRVAGLERQRALLDDPSYVASLARERLHYVRPGETTYVVIGPQAAVGPVPRGGAGPAGSGAPWWSQLWGSVRTADRPPG